MGAVRIFYSYCHGDAEEKKQMDKHLAILKKNGIVETWHDEEILPGENWQKQINQNLESAEIVLFLISSRFLDSPNCIGELQETNKNGKVIIPIILGRCAWEDFTFNDGTRLGETQAIPHKAGKLTPISQWEDKDEAWHSVYEDLKNVCKEMILNEKIHIKEEFATYLNSCDALEKSHPRKEKLKLSDIFVWPQFRKIYQESKIEILKEKSLFEDIDRLGKIWLVGEDGSGKTALGKKIFLDMRSKGFMPVLFDSRYEGKIENQLRNGISDQYTFNRNIDVVKKYENKIVIIIDDFHEIKNNQNLLKKLREFSFRQIIITDKVFSLNFKALGNIERDYCRYEIVEYYPSKRDEVIKKWIAQSGDEMDDNYKKIDEHTDRLNVALGKNITKGIVPSYPFFILTIISSYETGYLALDQTVTSQGHCYQALIYWHLKKQGVKSEDYDTYLNFVCTFAYFLYKQNLKKIRKEELEKFIEGDYKKKYHLLKKSKLFVKDLCRIGILSEDNEHYRFHYKYFYYYFVARYLAENLDQCGKDIHSIFHNLHKNENAYIAIFICHHSKDNRILENIQQNANVLFNKYNPTTLDKEEVYLIDKRMEYMSRNIVLPHHDVADEKRREELNRMDMEEKELSENNKNTEDGHEKARNSLSVELRRCVRAAEVMGHIIKNRSGSLEKEKIKSISRDAINILLRALGCFISELKREETLINLTEERLGKKLYEYAKKKGHEISESEAQIVARQFFSMVISEIVFGLTWKIVSSLGSYNLSEIIEEVCDEINVPSSILVKIGISLQYRKELSIEEIDRESKNFSRIAQYVRNAMISQHCHYHDIPYDKKQKIEEIFKIRIAREIPRIKQTKHQKSEDSQKVKAIRKKEPPKSSTKTPRRKKNRKKKH